MVKILKNCGYYVGDENGKVNIKTNILDFVLFTVYFIISLANSISSAPSYTIFMLNIISISRLILKNYFEQCKIIKKMPNNEGYVPANITQVHFFKIVVETVALILLFIFIIWNAVSNNNISAIKLMVIIVLIVTWAENILCVIERLYDAQPMPLIIYSSLN